ncbi:hypothetical protein AVEN_70180-1 [Araneus ventricosus]|uniref:Uncharacterized protein n=1 Tax=Araneus ventricosus TaxID=182803 RepID=A0A4Y2FHC9_ARAVE|nr:hypothetical protein AVEN_70180-1 [Araneus ventricosus]
MNSLWLVEYISFPNIATESIEIISHPGSSRRTGRPQKTSKVAAPKQKDGEFNTYWEHQARKRYRWLLKYSFSEKAKEIQQQIVKELCDFSPKRGTTILKKRGSVFQAQSKVVLLKTKC